MSTELINNNSVKITRFSGGIGRGKCFYIQINERLFHRETQHLDLTESDLKLLVKNLTLAYKNRNVYLPTKSQLKGVQNGT